MLSQKFFGIRNNIKPADVDFDQEIFYIIRARLILD